MAQNMRATLERQSADRFGCDCIDDCLRGRRRQGSAREDIAGEIDSPRQWLKSAQRRLDATRTLQNASQLSERRHDPNAARPDCPAFLTWPF